MLNFVTCADIKLVYITIDSKGGTSNVVSVSLDYGLSHFRHPTRNINRLKDLVIQICRKHHSLVPQNFIFVYITLWVTADIYGDEKRFELVEYAMLK